MKLVTKHMNFDLLKDNIISMNINEDCTAFTLEGIHEVGTALNQMVAIKSKPTRMITYVASFYVPKNILKELTGTLPDSITFVALICPNYITKYVASIGLKMYDRFYRKEHDETQVKVFMDENKAKEWIRSVS